MNKGNMRTERVGDDLIYVVDNLLTDNKIDKFYKYALKLPYYKRQRNFREDKFMRLSAYFDTEKFILKSEIGQISKMLLNEIFKNDNAFYLDDLYMNLVKYGDMEFPHRDCSLDENNVTILYYVNNYWDYKWGGETLFYSNQDSMLGILPLPGRFVIFKGNLEHKAGIPNINCREIRLSLAFKYVCK